MGLPQIRDVPVGNTNNLLTIIRKNWDIFATMCLYKPIVDLNFQWTQVMLIKSAAGSQGMGNLNNKSFFNCVTSYGRSIWWKMTQSPRRI